MYTCTVLYTLYLLKSFQGNCTTTTYSTIFEYDNSPTTYLRSINSSSIHYVYCTCTCTALHVLYVGRVLKYFHIFE